MTNNAIPDATPALNRLRAAAALIPIVESGFADGKISGDRAALMAAFCEWAIDLRPAIVAERGRFGDWEADLVIGDCQKQALVTLNERISRYR